MKVVKKAKITSKVYVRQVNQMSMCPNDYKCKHCLLSPGPSGCHCN